MSDDKVRIYPEITTEQKDALESIAKEEHRTLQGQVAHIIDLYLKNRTESQEVKNA